MEQTTVRISENMLVSINEYGENMDISQSEAIRELLDKGLDYDDLKNERDRIERKLQEANSNSDDIQEIKMKIERHEDNLNTPFFIRWYKYFRNKK